MKARPLLALAVLTLPVLPGCGHKGDPLPPLRRTPPAPSDFRFAQRGDVLELQASAPAASIDGVAYDRLALEFLYGTGEIDLEKRGQKRLAQGVPGQRVAATLPLPAPGTIVRATVRGAYSGERGARTVTKTLVAQAPLEPPRELQASAEEEGVRLSWQGVVPKEVEPPPVPRVPGAPPFGAALPGSSGAGRPATASPGPAAGTGAAPHAGAPPTPAAGAAAPATGVPTKAPAAAPPETGTTPEKAPGAATTPAPAATGAPVTAAAGTAATGAAATGATATGAAATGATGAALLPPARRNGFFIYRRVGNAVYSLPLVAEPLELRDAVDGDLPMGERACYVVRAIASTDPLIESAPSNEVCVERRDTTAPATPAGLALLPRGGGLEVLWSPSSEPDLAGYRVYRETSGQPRRRLAEAGTDKAAFVDETAAKGVTYRYTVTAFDQSGNESEPTDPVEGSLP